MFEMNRFNTPLLMTCLLTVGLLALSASISARSSTAERTTSQTPHSVLFSGLSPSEASLKYQFRLNGFDNFNAQEPISAASSNDNFADAQPLGGFSGIVLGGNVGYTREPGEPSHSFLESRHSAWFVWRAPASGSATFTTAGSNFDTAIAIYSGSALNALVRVASNGNASDYPQISTSRVTFRAVAETTYYIAVTGESPRGAGFTQGNIVLGWNLSTIDTTPPVIRCCVFAIHELENDESPCQMAVPDFTPSMQYSITDDFTDWPNFRISQTPSAGTLVGVGETPVTVTVQDEAGNTSVEQGSVLLRDWSPPHVTAVWLSTDKIHQNHGRFRADFNATDNCEPTPSISSKIFFFPNVEEYLPVRFEAANSDEQMIRIDYEKPEVILIGRDESAMRGLLAGLSKAGGIDIARGQVVEFFLDKELRSVPDKKNPEVWVWNGVGEYVFRDGVLFRMKATEYEMALIVQATDASGQQGEAYAFPPFEGDWVKWPKLPPPLPK